MKTDRKALEKVRELVEKYANSCYDKATEYQNHSSLVWNGIPDDLKVDYRLFAIQLLLLEENLAIKNYNEHGAYLEIDYVTERFDITLLAPILKQLQEEIK